MAQPDEFPIRHMIEAGDVQEGLQSLLGDLLGEEARQVVAAALG